METKKRKFTIEVDDAEEFYSALNNAAIAYSDIVASFALGLEDDLSVKWIKWAKTHENETNLVEILKNRFNILKDVYNQIGKQL